MKRLISIVLIAVMALTLSACATKRSREVVKGKESRMVIVEDSGTCTYCIVYDKETKVMYAVSDGAYTYGIFTLLVDANGNPLLYQGD